MGYKAYELITGDGLCCGVVSSGKDLRLGGDLVPVLRARLPIPSFVPNFTAF